MKGMFISRDKTAFSQLANEIAILKKMNHPNVVRLYEIIDDEKFDKLYMIMEYVDGGSLLTKIKSGNITLRNCWSYFRGLIAGLEYCHEKAGVVHRDIKPENILIDAHGNVKIADFGVSFMMDIKMNDELNTVVGSQYFLAPEVCSKRKFKGKPNDIWAVGVTLYYMITNKLPFNGNDIGELHKSILESQEKYPDTVSMLQKDLISKLLIKDPDKRMTVMEIKKHPWVTNNGVLKMQEVNGETITVNTNEIREAISIVKIYARIKAIMHKKLLRIRKKLGK